MVLQNKNKCCDCQCEDLNEVVRSDDDKNKDRIMSEKNTKGLKKNGIKKDE